MRLALIALFFSSGSCREGAKPNVILISIDCLNQRQFETALDRGYAPTLRALKEDSIAFSRAYAHAPWTTPAHMSMLTGLYPSQHGRDAPYGLMIQWNDFYSRVPAFETLADRLGGAGYDTAAFVGQGSISAAYGLDQGFEVFEEHRKARGSLTDLVGSTERALDWLSARGDIPFFLFFHTYDLHEPRPTGVPTDRDVLQYIDHYLSQIVLELKRKGLYESSLIILTGDHGSNMIETENKCCVHGAGHYEENLRVPLLVKVPHGDSGRDETFVARHVDLLPTVLELAGLDASTYDGPGVSLLGEGDREAVSYSEADGRCVPRRALVTERYKYIYSPAGARQALLQANDRFFDETCPVECRDVARRSSTTF